jgi:Flp pilus assembly protein TadD
MTSPDIETARSLFLKGQRNEAIALLAVGEGSEDAPARLHSQFGEFLLMEGRKGEALQAFSRSLEKDPRDYVSLLNLGILSLDASRVDHAVRFFQECLQVSPTSSEAWNNLGVTFQRAGRPADSVGCYVRALSLRPGFVDAMVNLSFAHHQCGDLDEALDAAEKALGLAPSNPVAHWHRGLALLSAGRLREGFAEYEWRMRHPQFEKMYAPFLSLAKPLWDGRVRPGKTLYVYAEQGLGDSLQFCRLLPLVASKGMTVVFECPQDLVRLVNQLPGVQVVPNGHLVEGAYDFHCPLLSLLHLIAFDTESIPADMPLLRVKPEWRKEVVLAPRGGFRVGLCWKGNPSHSDDLHRSAPLEAMHALRGVKGVEFVNLQKEATPQELHAFGDIATYEDSLADVAARAALVNQMHLVVTVDTAVAHIAGVLGVPCWTLLGRACDWRWGTQALDTPWYPGMRLFRQRTHGDWAELMDRVKQELVASVPPGVVGGDSLRSCRSLFGTDAL